MGCAGGPCQRRPSSPLSWILPFAIFSLSSTCVVASIEILLILFLGIYETVGKPLTHCSTKSLDCFSAQSVNTSVVVRLCHLFEDTVQARVRRRCSPRVHHRCDKAGVGEWRKSEKLDVAASKFAVSRKNRPTGVRDSGIPALSSGVISQRAMIEDT